MNFKLSKDALEALQALYGKDMTRLGSEEWKVSICNCGCSGDCGSNWMRS